MSPSLKDRYCGALLGLAVGDALGATLEFTQRGANPPLTDLVGGGPHDLEPGEWTDDTSMALCLGESLIHCQGFDPADQMERYVRWWREGYLSPKGRCFDIGTTTSAALARFEKSKEPFSGSPDGAGNGSLMRLAPVPLCFYPQLQDVIRYAGDSSRTTHGSDEAVDACRLFALMLFKALRGDEKEEILFGGPEEIPKLAPAIVNIAAGEYRDKEAEQIDSGGYVVHSLEASLWCFHQTDSYDEAVLLAANLADDSDTTAAIAGQLAGAFYGVEAIRPAWRERLYIREFIQQLAEKFYSDYEAVQDAQ